MIANLVGVTPDALHVVAAPVDVVRLPVAVFADPLVEIPDLVTESRPSSA